MTTNPAEKNTAAPVDAHTRLFAIVGDPISHVRAPVVWSELFRRFGINAVFLPAHAAPGSIDTVVAGLKALKNLDGLMFTMPHKHAALRHADRVTERARRIGSLNLMRPDADGGWTGDNVDGAGFIAGLQADGIGLSGAHVYVHGAGGVGQAVAWALAGEAIASLTLFDLDMARAEALAAAIAAECGLAVRAGAADGATSAGFDLLVNASPVGLEEGYPLPFAVDALKPGAVVADVIMEPMFTRLLVTARERGHRVHHGRHMMNHALPLAAAFYGLPADHDWLGGAVERQR